MYRIIDQEFTLRGVVHCPRLADRFARIVGGRVEKV